MALLSPAARQGTGPLARLMREGGLYCVFQPLADLREGQVYAHEALIRGPSEHPAAHPRQTAGAGPPRGHAAGL